LIDFENPAARSQDFTVFAGIAARNINDQVMSGRLFGLIPRR
jgi:hypothetical protein